MNRAQYNKELFEAIMRDAKVLPPEPPKTRPVQEESKIQSSCVRWFRYQYRQYSKMLFAIPNGGSRSKSEATRFKAEGVVAGVADLCLAVPRGWYGALYIEMKQKGNYQQPNQKEWQKICEESGNKYVVCKSIDEFMREVNAYMYLPSFRQLRKEYNDMKEKLKY